MAPQDQVTIGGANYLISGFPTKQVVAWKLIFRGGEQLSKGDFMALPVLDREMLLHAVVDHIDKVNKAGR